MKAISATMIKEINLINYKKKYREIHRFKHE